MNYALFYNKQKFGDLLMIVFDQKSIPTSTVKEGDLIKIYNGDELIGINIFGISKIIKIKANGLIPFPNKIFIDVLNTILTQHSLPTLESKKNSGFIIGRIVSCIEHEESSHLHILKVDIGEQVLDIVCGAANVAVGEIVVVATIGTYMFDGTMIEKGNLLGVDSYGMCCSERELNLTDDKERRGLLLLDESYKIGSDFFEEFSR